MVRFYQDWNLVRLELVFSLHNKTENRFERFGIKGAYN